MAALKPARLRWRTLALPCLLLFTYLLSAAWAVTTPIPDNRNATGAEWGNFHPDDGDHVDIVRYMAETRTLPPYTVHYYISVHPPLYHGLGALVYALAYPHLGYDGAMRQVRLLSCLCGVGIVYLTYRATRRAASRATALFAATLVALLPMRVSLGAAITNENLAALGAAGVLATIVGGIYNRDGFKTRQIVLLALYLCVGIGSKITCLGLLPIVGLALFYKARLLRAPLALPTGQFLLLNVVVIACWGWWFARNQTLYGDPLRSAAADRLWNVPPTPVFVQEHRAALVYWIKAYGGSWRSFWGTFDGMRRPMPLFVYAVAALVQVVSLMGLRRRRLAEQISRRDAVLFTLFILFAAFVFVFFTLYNVRHSAAQGRYFFVLLLPFGLLTAVGWSAALGRRTRRWATPILFTFLTIINLYLLYVIPRRLNYFGSLPATPWHPPAATPAPA